MATYHIIGQPTPRVDGTAKATGQARYTADVSLPGTLWGKSLHSPYAHARIVRTIRQQRGRFLVSTPSSRALMSEPDCGAGR